MEQTLNLTQQLAGAESADTVVALANQYLSGLSPHIIANFPASCRPQAITDAAAIHHWRRQLLAEVCTLPGTPDLRLQELAVFFLRASMRAHALATPDATSARAAAPAESTAA
jgi:hypothetical protein